VPAHQVMDNVWLVASATDPTARTDEHDCHAYLVWDGSGGFLIDSGAGIVADRWLANAREVCDLEALGGVLVTHYHADHAGGAASASAVGLRLFASADTARALAAADEDRTQLARARAAGIYPADYRLSPAEIDQVVTEEVTLRSGGVTVEVVDAPGHCDGHVVFAVSGGGPHLLFSGDCLFAQGRVSMQAIPDCRLDRYAETVLKLAGRDVDALLPGHGDLVLEHAHQDVSRAAESFARLLPPPNFLV
jgi:glyoxylase-like metal-dependent hydrolase (beta-lactamase superfamily II)